MNKLYCLIATIYLCSITSIRAQQFINCDLNGTITGFSCLPTDWSNVPYGDVNCMASGNSESTPDLTSYTQPLPFAGIIGNPYSGNTFMSGLFSSFPPSAFFWHEGIMQTVSGFIPGNTYPISFYQAVVKQHNALDSSGSWAVYIDSVLAGITAPTFSNAPFNSTSFIWEFRTISFVASSVSHTIKFLPIDDDTSFSQIDSTGLRMGIDYIYITYPCDSVNAGINDNNLINSFTIYPNPINEKLNIKSNNNDFSEIILYDITSRKTIQQSFINSTTINTEQLAKGIYIYEVRNRSGVIKKGKVVRE